MATGTCRRRPDARRRRSAETAGKDLVSLWGRAAVSRFDGREGELTVDGEVVTGMLGTDWTRGSGAGAWNAGLIVTHSAGEGGYWGAPAAGDGASRSGASGKVEAVLTSLFPWVRHALTERLEAWGAAGQGATAAGSGSPSKQRDARRERRRRAARGDAARVDALVTGVVRRGHRWRHGNEGCSAGVAVPQAQSRVPGCVRGARLVGQAGEFPCSLREQGVERLLQRGRRITRLWAWTSISTRVDSSAPFGA